MTSAVYEDRRINNRSFLRKFKRDVPTDELVWHRDAKSRYIEVIEGSGWEFQFEDQLPVELKENDVIYIPAKTYHRIKPGNTDLMVKIEEFEE